MLLKRLDKKQLLCVFELQLLPTVRACRALSRTSCGNKTSNGHGCCLLGTRLEVVRPARCIRSHAPPLCSPRSIHGPANEKTMMTTRIGREQVLHPTIAMGSRSLLLVAVMFWLAHTNEAIVGAKPLRSFVRGGRRKSQEVLRNRQMIELADPLLQHRSQQQPWNGDKYARRVHRGLQGGGGDKQNEK